MKLWQNMARHAGLAWAAGAVLLAAGPDARAEARPNVVVVLCDDLRWDTLGCAGHPHVRTPHIDRLAAEGVRFANAFCTTSLCSPSRASILSGLLAHAHGVQDNFTEFPASLPNFPARLQAAGWRTAYIGKWHMGENNDEPRPGFDHWISHKGQGKYYGTEFNVNGARQTPPDYYTKAVTDYALDFVLRQTPGRPFMLFLGHKAPHSYYIPEPKYSNAFDQVAIAYPDTAFQLDGKPEWIRQRLDTWHGIYGPLFEWRKQFPDRRPEAVKDFAAMTRAYWGAILSVDDSVGRLYEALERTEQLDRTIFIFMGDNGLLNGEHGMVDKRTMHEPSIRIPLIVRHPAVFQRPRVARQLVLAADIAPTILDLCGLPPLQKVHGRSFKTIARTGAGPWRESFFYAYNYEKQFPYTPNVRGVRTADWKYIHYPHGDGSPDRHMAELYHLEKDPEERRNLINDPAHAARARELRLELGRLMRLAGALPDRMPLDEGVKGGLPDAKLR